MRDVLEFLQLVGVVILIFAGIFSAFAALFFVFAAINRAECANLNEVTKRKTDFRWLGGCYVEHEGEMLPYERWKLLDVRIKERQ